MPQHRSLPEHDPHVSIDENLARQALADDVFLGSWFVFLRQGWLAQAGLKAFLPPSSEAFERASIVFRGQEHLRLQGLQLSKPLPEAVQLVSLTSDKSLYRQKHDPIHLLIVAPEHQGEKVQLSLYLYEETYADYKLTLDEYGLCLLSLQDLPAGQYRAELEDYGGPACSFEIAEYRLAALNAELSEQRLSGDTLRYTLAVSSFNQPYSGPIEIELQEQGQRVGSRTRLHCNRAGEARGAFKLTGAGPFTLNIFAGERTATVPLKGTEQERRETLTISELGEGRELSLLPLPRSNMCRGMYITRGAANNEPFLVQRALGREVEIMPRVAAAMLRVVVVDAVHGTYEETYHEQVQANQPLRMPIPAPYGIVLLGAFIEGQAWEGWCAVLRPPELQLQCTAPQKARPGSRVTIKLKTSLTERVVPIHLIIKDQRLSAQSDPQVELAACIKENLAAWDEQSVVGFIERSLGKMQLPSPIYARPMLFRAMAAPQFATGAVPVGFAGAPLPTGSAVAKSAKELTKVRMQFPEVIYNNIVKVRGETELEVKLGDSLTRYSIEAFAILLETLDWQRVETSLEAVQPVYGELSVSPFVFPGDPVLGRLDVGAASGSAIVDVRHNGEILPLFYADGTAVTPGLPIPSGSALRFLVRPGTITSTVRDGRQGGSDVSERYVSEPGQLRHIQRSLRLLQANEEVNVRELQALELRLLPTLEQPFTVLVEAASRYPYGCIEQTSLKLLAMFTGYITAREAQKAREYEAAILPWYKRLQSMYLPGQGFCMYPPEESGQPQSDHFWAPKGVRHLLSLPRPQDSGLQLQSLQDILQDIYAMALDAASYYKLANPPREIKDCHDAYLVLTAENTSPAEKGKALAFVRTRLKAQGEQTYVEDSEANKIYGPAVARRQETAYAAAALLRAGNQSDLPRALAATNYLSAQLNEQGCFYSTIDTAAGLALFTALRAAGLLTETENEKQQVRLNGQPMSLTEALSHTESIESIRCLSGLALVQITSEVSESWSTFKSQLAVAVQLEKDGRAQRSFQVGDELELVISVPRYEAGLIAHICLPDALARIIGGAQVKRFSLDFCGKKSIRIPLAAITATSLPDKFSSASETDASKTSEEQHWAVIVRNMFKEEQVGNPGLLKVVVKEHSSM
ncbi:hypothetical protein EPA93_25835 [Ktedonosporobacter rubrisoli]|uniref:Alpha-2-macroglobulin domain-containing protein n=1 Tax=Ktedonosporobacter rubrisoli TaxID=2509675 RepID=A0A4P6JW51_KTERU|nr:hypothetical protein [Ktedonosporobacter rubrisoli]QBD79216.1 hypothetical protein EPA93_25835 [Ktedonosporobacter rubrisoli]